MVSSLSILMSLNSGRERGCRTRSRSHPSEVGGRPLRICAACLSAPGAERSAAICDLYGCPTPTQRLIQANRVGQDLLMAGQQRKPCSQQRTLVFKHVELRDDTQLELRLEL